VAESAASPGNFSHVRIPALPGPVAPSILSLLFPVLPLNLCLGAFGTPFFHFRWTLTRTRITLLRLLFLQFDSHICFACLLVFLPLDLGFELLCDLHIAIELALRLIFPPPSHQQDSS
jgi:hypothetical protein